MLKYYVRIYVAYTQKGFYCDINHSETDNAIIAPFLIKSLSVERHKIEQNFVVRMWYAHGSLWTAHGTIWTFT